LLRSSRWFFLSFAAAALTAQTVLIPFAVDLTFEKLSWATMSNETIVVLEERHKELGLKHVGASEISDRLNVISWRICGEEYVLLEDKDVVRNVLKFPKHSKDSPAFIGSCQLNGHDVPGTAIGVLKNENGVAILPAVSAWKIDDKQMKFVELKTEGLRYSRDGIITADGGF
jgi:hypothetical protein